MRERIFKTKGPLDPVQDQAVLIERREAWQIVRAATQPAIHGYIALLSPRQTGKTTLLHHARVLLEQQGCAVAMVDLAPLENRDEAECYRFVCRQILADLGSQLRLPKAAREKLEEVTCPTAFYSFLSEVAQRARPARLVIMLDEIRAIPSQVASGFFGTIRSVFSSRRKPNEQVLEKYLFVLSGAAELYELTSGKNSPLNICETIHLQDLDAEQVGKLAANLERAGTQISPEAAAHLHRQTGGHPYLTQRLCSILEMREVPEATIAAIDEAVSEMLRGDDNLDHLSRQLAAEPAMRDLAHRILLGKHPVAFSRVDQAVSRLEMIGAIGDSDPCAIRNPIYRRTLEKLFGLSPQARGFRAHWRRHVFTALVALLFLLTLPNLILYVTEVLFAERFVNQAIALPALNVTGYVRHDALIGLGEKEEIEVELVRTNPADLSPLRVEIKPHDQDVASADGNYALIYRQAHESQRFQLLLRKSARVQDFVFPLATQRERRVDVFVLPEGKARPAELAPTYTLTMKVDYFSTFVGSALVWVLSILAGIGSLLGRLDMVGDWLAPVARIFRPDKGKN